MKSKFLSALTLAALCVGVHAQSTNAIQLPSPLSEGLTWPTILIAVFVPAFIAVLKLVLPKIPKNLLPALAVGLGCLADYMISRASGSTFSPVIGMVLGAAGVGLREIVDQHKELFTGGVGTALLMLMLLLPIGCSTTLEPGGAYAPLQTNSVSRVVNLTNSVGAITQTNVVDAVVSPASAPDPQFAAVESLADLTITAIDKVFNAERDNRATLQAVSPQIKEALDKIRPDAWAALVTWAKARKAYEEHPTPAGLDELQTILSRLQKISAAVAVIQPPVQH